MIALLSFVQDVQRQIVSGVYMVHPKVTSNTSTFTDNFLHPPSPCRSHPSCIYNKWQFWNWTSSVYVHIHPNISSLKHSPLRILWPQFGMMTVGTSRSWVDRNLGYVPVVKCLPCYRTVQGIGVSHRSSGVWRTIRWRSPIFYLMTCLLLKVMISPCFS